MSSSAHISQSQSHMQVDGQSSNLQSSNLEGNLRTNYIDYFERDARFAFYSPRPQTIRQRRALLSGTLLFDTLLFTGGITDPASLYPPKDLPALRRLVAAIQDSSRFDQIKRDSAIYYLLKWHETDDRARSFASSMGVHPQFTALTDAYWYLDQGVHIRKAIALLSDCRVARDWTSKIMQIISLAPHSEASDMIVQYVRTVRPLLIEAEDIELYLTALAEKSILDAWRFISTFDDYDMRHRLLQLILHWSVQPRPKSKALQMLLHLPFERRDEVFFHKHLMDPPEVLELDTDAIHILQELACTRLIQVGRHAEAIRLDAAFCAVPNAQIDEQRQHVIHNLVQALPAAERALLDVNIAMAPQIAVLDVSMSWEDLRRSAMGPQSNSQPRLNSSQSRLNQSQSRLSSSLNTPAKLNASQSQSKPTTPASSSRVVPFTPSLKSPSTLQGLSGALPPPSLRSTRRDPLPQVSASTPKEVPKFESARNKVNAFYKPPPGVPQPPSSLSNGAAVVTLDDSMTVDDASPSAERRKSVHLGGVTDSPMQADNAFDVSIFSEKPLEPAAMDVDVPPGEAVSSKRAEPNGTGSISAPKTSRSTKKSGNAKGSTAELSQRKIMPGSLFAEADHVEDEDGNEKMRLEELGPMSDKNASAKPPSPAPAELPVSTKTHTTRKKSSKAGGQSTGSATRSSKRLSASRQQSASSAPRKAHKTRNGGTAATGESLSTAFPPTSGAMPAGPVFVPRTPMPRAKRAVRTTKTLPGAFEDGSDGETVIYDKQEDKVSDLPNVKGKAPAKPPRRRSSVVSESAESVGTRRSSRLNAKHK